MPQEELQTPQATYIQTGERATIRVVGQNNNSDAYEGDIPQLAEESNNPRFMDLFWFFNPSASEAASDDTTEKPLELVTFTLNLNFGNLRINGYREVRPAFHNQALFLTRDLLTINAAVYPTGLFNIRHLNNGEQYRPIEQLFVGYNPSKEPWHDELTRATFRKNNDRIKMTLRRGEEENYYYISEKRQYDLFNYALDFLLKDGLTLVGSKK